MTPTSVVRLFEPTTAEYEAIVAVYNVVNPEDPGSAESWQHWDLHRDPAKIFRRYVVEDEGQIVGYGFSTLTDPAANKFRFAAYLLPEWETADLLDAFYHFIMDHCQVLSPSAFICGIREDQSVQTAWLEGHGFMPVMRYPSSILDVQAFDSAPFRGLIAKLMERGIEFLSLKELAEQEPDWQRIVYDLEMLINEDVPRPSTFSPTPFEQYAQREFDDPNFMPEAWLVARDGDTYIGTASAFKAGSDFKIMVNGLTGVRRDYRRLGVATALKSQLIEVVKAFGTQTLQTYNEENNPMFLLNVQLGYVPQPADVDWEKSI